MKRYLILFTIILIISSFFTIESLASSKIGTKDIDLYVDFGYQSNKLTHYKWMPVNVHLENLSKNNIEGNLVLSFIGESNEKINAELSLPPGVKKTLVFYVFYQGQERYNVSIENKKGKTIYNKGSDYVPVDRAGMFASKKNLIGVLTDDKDSLNYIDQLAYLELEKYLDFLNIYYSETEIGVERINSKNFPVKREAIEAFDIIVVNNFDITNLTDEQRDVFNYYIETGGNIIFSTGVNYTTAFKGMDKYVNPLIHSNNKEEIEISILGEEKESHKLLLDVLDFEDDNLKVILEENLIPFAYKHDLYNIYYLTYSLNDRALTNWAHNYRYLADFIFAHTNSLKIISYSDNTGITKLLGLQLAGGIPSMLTISIIVLLYLALIGPVSYAILKKKKKQEYMWITIPSFVILFSLAVFIYGFIARGGGSTQSSLLVVELNESTSYQKPAYLATTFMTSSSGSHSLSYDRTSLFGKSLLLEGWDYEIGSNASYWQGDRSEITFTDATMWSLLGGESRIQVDDYGYIESEIEKVGKNSIRVKLKNNTKRDLRQLIVTLSDNIRIIDEFKYLDTIELDFTWQNFLVGDYENLIKESLYSHYGLTYWNYMYGAKSMMFDEIGSEKGMDLLLISQFLSNRGGGDDLSLVPQLYIAGLANEELDFSVKINGKKPTEADTRTIVYQKISLQGFIEIDFESGYEARLISSESENVKESMRTYILESDSKAYFEVKVPYDLLYRESSVALSIKIKDDKDIVVYRVNNSGGEKILTNKEEDYLTSLNNMELYDFSKVDEDGKHNYDYRFGYCRFLIKPAETEETLEIEEIYYRFIGPKE